MINIISNIANTDAITGPSKVLNNTIKGLELIGYPYVVNAALNCTSRVWIQSGWDALPYVCKTTSRCVIGPNVALYPDDIAQYDISKAIFLQPGPTAVKFWNIMGFNQCPLKYWPAGIDTEQFAPSDSVKKDIVLVYHKQRDLNELQIILNTLANKRINFALIPYGAYYEEEYLSYLARARYVVWHGRHESQGIALQEAMACNVPIIVCDVTTIGQSQHSKVKYSEKVRNIGATAIPYFNDECGLSITSISKLDEVIDEMESTYKTFTPRNYVLQNLSLEKQAQELVKFWEYWNYTFEEGKVEKASSDRKFTIPITDRISKLLFRMKRKVKQGI